MGTPRPKMVRWVRSKVKPEQQTRWLSAMKHEPDPECHWKDKKRMFNLERKLVT